MGSTELRAYFTAAGQQRALEAYARFARGSAWSVPHKVELYGASLAAFGPGAADEDRRPAFDRIYDGLVGHWRVFRPHGAAGSWRRERIFDTLRREFGPFAWSGPLTLAAFRGSGREQAVMLSMLALRDLKPNAGYPTMAASKFLHFFNPGLFPIYDTEVVGNRVFRRFKPDFAAFCAGAGLDKGAEGAKFLRNYMAWGSSLLADAGPPFMPAFVDWLRDALPRRDFEAAGPATLAALHATAFEFTVIGAAVAEGC